MAILKNLIVNGSSRFLNTAYFQDVSIAGSAALASLSLSGTLSVTGATTLSGTLGVTGAATFGNITATGTVVFSKTQDLSGTANSSPALIVGGTATSAHMEFDANEIHAKATGTTVADLYLNNQGGKVYLSGNSVYASGSTFVAPTANLATVNATNVNVTNNLRANHYDLQTVAQLGGSFYVSPTVKFPNSGTTLVVAKSGSTLTLTITDSSITSTTMAGVVWAANSHVKVSGTINGVVTGTMDGTVSSINTSSHVLTLSVSGENSSSVVAGSYTASQFSDLTVMIYQRRDESNDYRVGIWMNCYDVANSSSTIRIYGGSDANPNVMLGNLTSAGLGTVNNLTPTGWGLFAQNAFLHGKVVANGGLIGNWTIGESSMYYSSDTPSNSSIVLAPGGKTASVNIGGSGTAQKSWVFTVKNLFGVDTSGALYSSSGKIGGWNIGTSSLYNTTNSMTSTGVGLYLGTDGIRNYASGTQYVNITGGKITALGVDVSGKITATSGAIGGFDITSTAIKTKNVEVTSNADNSISLSSADFTRTINSTSREGLRFAIGDKFGVTGDGTIYAGSANISGTLTAGNGSKIGDLTIANGKLSVPAANITGTLSADHIDASSLTIGQSQVTGLSTALGNKADSSTVTALTNKVNAVYGTCGTAAATQIKTVTCSGFTLYDGALITVKFTNSNTFSSAKIIMNINSTGNKDVYVSGGITSASNNLVWASGAEILFKYTGGAYTVVDNPKTWSGSCSSAETNPEKEVSIPGCVICKGAVVKVKMTYSNTADCGLNVSSTGNFSIHVKTGSDYPTVASGYSWTAGGTPEFVFNGIHWVLSSPDIESAKTATNYLYFDSNNGLVISQTGGASPSGYNTQINSTGMSIRNGSTTLASYGSSIILGELASGKTHIEIDSDSFDVCSGAATGANSTKLATFGTTITLGQIANGVTRIQIDNDSFDVISRTNGTDTTIATFGTTVTLGNTSVQHIVINDTSFSFNDGDNIQMQIDSSGFHFGEEDSSGDLIDDIQFGVSQSGIIFKNKIFDEYYKPEVFSVNITDTELHQYTVTRQYQYTKGDSDMQFDERRGNIYELGTFLKGITPQVYLSYYKQNSDLSIVVENTELLDSSYYTYGFDEVYEDTDEDSPEYGYKGPRAWVIFNSSGISAINSKLSSYSTAHSWPYNTGFYDIHFNVTTKDPPSANLDMYGDLNVKSRVYLEGSDIREEGGNIICREIANEDGITLGSIKDTMQFVNAQWISATAVVASGASGTAKGTFTKVNNATGYIAIPISTYEWNICTSNPVISGTNISAGVKNISSGQHTCAVRILVLGYKWAN